MRKIFHTMKTILYGLIEHTCFCRLGLLCPIDPREHTREEKKNKKDRRPSQKRSYLQTL